MTNQEAVLKLKIILGNALLNPRLKDQEEEFLKAVDMAITALQSDPNAPDWSQAPKWANYYAIDADGQRFWFENEPQKVNLSYEEYFGSWSKDKDPKNMKLFKRPDL